MSTYHIRPGQPSDMPQIHNIFTHYVLNTTTSFYFEPPALSVIESKYETAQSRGLPYLVAIDSSSKTALLQDKKEDEEYQDNLLGYAYALPYRMPLQAYAHSVEISIFLHPSHVHRGIGTGLMKALLDRLRTATHRAYEPAHEDQARDVKVRNVFAIMALDVNGPDREDGEKLRVWYEGFGFEVVARLRNVGWKKGRWIDTLYLQLDLDPDSDGDG